MSNYNNLVIETLLQNLNSKGEGITSLPTAIYARKSTRDTSQVSIDGQIEVCKNFINNNPKLYLIKEYSEENVSGYHLEHRKQIQLLIDDVKNGKIKVVVAYSLDRISRNVVDGALLDQILEEAGAIVLYATQTFSSDADGNFTKNILRAVAQRLPESTAETTMRSMMKKANEKSSTGGPIPYGYKVINKEFFIEETEAPAVRLMFNGIISGLTIPEIIKTLTSKGYLTRANKPFSPQTIHRILRSEKYKGTYLYNRSDGRKRKNRVLKRHYDEVRINDGFPKIVDPNLFDKVQVLLCKTTKKTSPLAKEPYVLTGVLKCGCCGNTMHGYASIGGKYKKRYTNYTCRGGKSRDFCGLSIRQEYIEMLTANVIISVLNKWKIKTTSLNTVFLEMKTNMQKEYTTLKNQIIAKKKEVNKLITSLSNSTDVEVSKIITNQIKERNLMIQNKEKLKEDLKKRLLNIKEVVKKFISGEIEITSKDIIKDKEIFKILIDLIIKDITITKDNISLELNDLNE